MRRMNDVVGLRRFDCEGILGYGRSLIALLGLLLFLARWSDADQVHFTTGARAS